METLTAIRARVWLTALAIAAVVTALLGWGVIRALDTLDRGHAVHHLSLLGQQVAQWDPLPPAPKRLRWWREGQTPPADLPAPLLQDLATTAGNQGVWRGTGGDFLWIRVIDARHGDLWVVERRPELGLAALWRADAGALLAGFAALVLLGLWGTHRLSLLLAKLEQNRMALRHQALHDRLTGLPNRELLLDRLEQALHQAQRARRPFALCLLDLDRFKDINDTLGHAVGDEIVRQLANRLRATLRRCDTLARMGGDEFAVILNGVDAERARHVMRKLLTRVEEPVSLEDQSFFLSASCGIALYPEHGRDAATLLRHADTAMFTAKRDARRIVLYSPRLDQWDKERLALVQDLRQAIEEDALDLYYQPKVDIQSGRVVGAEALARWHHPRLGAIPPATFVRLAEHTGLIKPLTRWVIRRAFADMAEFRAHGLDLAVSLNLSALDLADPDLHRHIAALAQRSGVEPARVTLELTETEVMRNPEQSRRALERLKRRGFHIAIDDFGTGYASLENLRRLPVGEIKIDRSFVANLLEDGDDAAIVRATVSLAEALGLGVVAEGVESDAVARSLREFGCSVVQGYFIARPMDKASLLTWLAQPEPRLLPSPA